METNKSIIKGDSIQSWAFEMENRKWISKKDVEFKGGGIGSEIEYTTRIDEKGKEIVDKIISVKKGEEKLLFGNNYFKNFESLAKSLSLDYFEINLKSDLNNINSGSSLRNVFDTYLKIYEKEDFEIEIEILFAKIAYQEKRKSAGKTILPEGFAKFLRKIYEEKLSRNKDDFKKFLEVFVAYHKYYTGK